MILSHSHPACFGKGPLAQTWMPRHTGEFGSEVDRRGSLREEKAFQLTKSHSLLPSVLSLWNIRCTMCGQLIRDTALFTFDHRGIEFTRVYVFPAVQFIIIFAAAISN